ncbi:MAG TPA: hypothetical protein IAC94_02530 [Candidatus Coprenecus avistercoris]|uniref:Uncharacterized protein n=1 Tax=Candidatus Coprenecus avistercoris TaxID=2840730 RepID=A0A9D1E0U9_9BACT|nr:hypothetical protein [Candidatus Coprenecus avistercoris]
MSVQAGEGIAAAAMKQDETDSSNNNKRKKGNFSITVIPLILQTKKTALKFQGKWKVSQMEKITLVYQLVAI